MRCRDERGSVSLWMLTATLVMIVLTGLAVDLGGQVHAKQRAQDIAAQAARAGGQQVQAAPAIEGRDLTVDAAAARSAAQGYLTGAGVQGTVTVTGGDTITVHVSDHYSPTFLGFLGDLKVTGHASARIIRSLGGTER